MLDRINDRGIVRSNKRDGKRGYTYHPLPLVVVGVELVEVRVVVVGWAVVVPPLLQPELV